MRKVYIVFFTVGISLTLVWSTSYSVGQLKQFPFDRQNALKEWKEKIFQGRVLYEVKAEGTKGYVFAKSDKASSGLFYPISYSLKKYPYISWIWRVKEFPLKTHAGASNKKSWIERDDYAVRMYVIFPAFIFTNTRCLEYIWSESLPKDTVLTSPFYKNIKLLVLESGSKDLGQWVSEERNVYEDYKKAFGRYPSSNVGAIAIMTDADNTQSSAEAGYSDIKIGYERPLLVIPEIKKAGAIKPKPQGLQEYIEHLFRKGS